LKKKGETERERERARVEREKGERERESTAVKMLARSKIVRKCPYMMRFFRRIFDGIQKVIFCKFFGKEPNCA